MENQRRFFGVFSGIRMGDFLLVLLVMSFIIAGAGSAILTRHVLREHALEMAESKSRLILDHNLAIHTYFTHDLKPSLFDSTDSFLEEGYFDPTWMSSTYAVRKVEDYFQQINPSDYYYKEAALDARSPQNEADAYELHFLTELNQDPDLVVSSVIREIEGEKYFTVLRRGETMQEDCLVCHSDPETAPIGLVEMYGDQRSFQREVGDVVSAISIRVPLEKTYQEMSRLAWMISGFVAVSLVLVFGVLNLVRVRAVMQPLQRISDKARLISSSSQHLGETIQPPVFREMRRITESFNAMSLALQEERDHLEERVKARTSELEETKERMEHMAQHDALTGLPNRRLFEEHMNQAVKMARREKVPLTLMVSDLDGFKEINDNFGHSAGDYILRVVGERISRALRESDLVARWGGDEFILLLYDAEGKEDLELVAGKIFAALEDPIEFEGKPFQVRISIGAANFPRDGEDMDSLLKQADAAMYRAKEQGGNTCWCSAEDWDENPG